MPCPALRSSGRRLAPQHADRNELNIFGRTRRDGGRLARRPPIIEQALRHAAQPGALYHLARRPRPAEPPSPPRSKCAAGPTAPGCLLPLKQPPSGVQREAPEISWIAACYPRRYTTQAGRLRSMCSAITIGARATRHGHSSASAYPALRKSGATGASGTHKPIARLSQCRRDQDAAPQFGASRR